MRKKSVTLVELIIAVSLLLVIIVGAGAFNLASRELLTSSETKTQVLNELTFVLEHIGKNVSLATGDVSNDIGNISTGNSIGIEVSAGPPKILRIRQDINPATGVWNNTPDNYSDDRIVEYTFKSGFPYTIDFEGEILTDGFVEDTVFPFDITVKKLTGGVEITNLAVMLDPPITDADPRDNPLVTIVDKIGNPTVFFFPLSHSWN